ncbi:MAG TPA: altronate dehydratase family protein [Polyangiaceae bacterium]|jgi:altronate hydrolase|nr:altronate dehydratase family protein [Polyangiaceae bacterium]
MDVCQHTILIHPADDVLIAKRDLTAGTVVRASGEEIVLRQNVPAGHKVARRNVAVGAPVRRYGEVIGFASAGITAGELVHVHNLDSENVGSQYHPSSDVPVVDFYPPDQMRHFEGYKRPDGRVGTRNYVAIVSTVNCSASVTQFVRERFRDVQRDFPGIDGVIALTHKSGCGQVLGGEDHRLLERVLAGYARHPNVAAFVVIGLGCEVNQAPALVERHKLSLMNDPRERPPIITIQESGGVRKAVEAAVSAVAGLLPRANEARRTKQPVSELVLATNCGGSDGNSGITANPALGWAVDELVRYGGTGILAETTEMYGAEHVLIRRAKSKAVADKLAARIGWWKRHLAKHGAAMSDNPAPGNKAGGLTTLFEKSLGGMAKGGSTPLMDVFEYAEPVTTRGFVFMDTPGHDPVSITGLVAGGANVICFTTGRGSVLGCKPAPSIKLATNSPLFKRMEDDMDIDCGVVLDGVPIEEVGRRVFEEVLSVASGKKSKSELSGVGEEEFAPWMMGPVL